MLQQGDPVPHFEVTTLQGLVFDYSSIWQRRNLLLVMFPVTERDLPLSYVSQLRNRAAEFAAQDTECVMTRDRVAGISAPAVIVADRWGEIIHLAAASDVADLPTVEELSEWLTYVQNRCPECEGEAT
jgi:hypothetical protein